MPGMKKKHIKRTNKENELDNQTETVETHIDKIIKEQKPVNKNETETHSGDVLSEKTGFGWKGLGSRRIFYDNNIKENVYQVIEPKLTKEEEEIKKKLIYLFRTRADVDVFEVDEDKKKQRLEKALEKTLEENHLKIDSTSKDKIFYYVFQDFIGYGKIDILMHDEGIEDISCDGSEIPIFIFHKKFESIRTNIIYKNNDELDSFVVKLSQMCGKQISVYEPIVDGKLADGSRLQTTLGNTITKLSTFTIRRFREDPLTPVDLIENNTMNLEMAAYFWMAIEKGTSILFCGGTASGKTTALNALSLFLPATFKIVSIEDTREINLPHENWIAGTTRAGFTASDTIKTGKDIDMFDLIRVALRQRPRVIIVGEVRGKEAYTLFQAMTTGHLSYSTIHASDLHTLIQRLENPPISLPRALLTSLDLIIFLNSVIVDGKPARRITNVTEVLKLDPESNRLVTLTPFHWLSEIDDRFEGTSGSRIMQKLKMQYGWTDERLHEEVENRKKILEWMMQTNQRSYQDMGRIVAEYNKDPKKVMERVKGEKA
jgi:flagellar protein FlaI